MIKQAPVSQVNSRLDCNPYMDNGFLPLIVSPMNSVINEDNYRVFLDNKINICMPRNTGYQGELDDMILGCTWNAVSLEEFIKIYITDYDQYETRRKEQICIDTASGNMNKLHQTIYQAKQLYGEDLIIMSGNVGTVDAFERLAWSGVDYIRVGVGGSDSCNTTKNTGVGQLDLEYLITDISNLKHRLKNKVDEKSKSTCKAKIVADGISSHVKKCQTLYGFNDNGYAAINKLLWVGADLVMVGTLFAQCYESAGKKRTAQVGLEVLMSGMSTHLEQSTYKSELRHSEGSTNWIPIRWYLEEWLTGNPNQDNYPYLAGFIPCLRSAMSSTNAFNLNEFKE